MNFEIIQSYEIANQDEKFQQLTNITEIYAITMLSECVCFVFAIKIKANEVCTEYGMVKQPKKCTKSVRKLVQYF